MRFESGESTDNLIVIYINKYLTLSGNIGVVINLRPRVKMFHKKKNMKKARNNFSACNFLK
jgi:hypothetical protein